MKYAVHIIEAERGWGRKIDSTRLFDTYEEARAFMTKFNADLPDAVNGRAPDWYMQAEGPYERP